MKETATAGKRTRKEYIPATVKVTTVSTGKVLCSSPNETEAYHRENW